MKTSISNNETCHCCFYNIRDICRIRRFITLSIAKTIATALVSSRHDYCNSLLYNAANKDIAKLQCPKLFSKGSHHMFSSFFSLSVAFEIISSRALSHYFQDLYSGISSTLIYTTSISKFDANSSKKSR